MNYQDWYRSDDPADPLQREDTDTSTRPGANVDADADTTSCMWHSYSFCRPESGGGAGILTKVQPKLFPSMQDLEDDRDPTLIQDLTRMTIEQRQTMYESIHAVEQIPDEDPRHVARCLTELHQSLDKIPASDRTAYNQAMLVAPTLVQDPAFRLMFLRSASFDVAYAARRLITHFECKRVLFGDAKLGKKYMTVEEDLDEDDQEALRSGFFQFLPDRDVAGRVIFFHDRRFISWKTWKNVFRAVWYLVMIQVQDETVQRQGVVWIGYNVGSDAAHAKRMTELALNMTLVAIGIPLRLSAFHQCAESHRPGTRFSLSFLHKILGSRFCHHVRCHRGSHLECRYALSSFGIPVEILPLNDKGEGQKDWLMQYIESRKRIEANAELLPQKGCASSAAMVEQVNLSDNGDNNDDSPMQLLMPNDNDVILGKGAGTKRHPGNLEFKRLVMERQPAYSMADKFQKTIISWDIIKIIQQDRGGRFLEREANWGIWNIVQDEWVRTKVANAFRTMRHRGGGGLGQMGGPFPAVASHHFQPQSGHVPIESAEDLFGSNDGPRGKRQRVVRK